MNTADNNDDNILKCAACGHKSGDGLKMCTACKLVKYCNASCQRAHWSKHKKECKKRAAELHDEALFKQPPSRDECDICMLTLPIDTAQRKYQPCCGKMLCFGCIHAAFEADNLVAFVHFAELLKPLRTGRQSKGLRNGRRLVMPMQCAILDISIIGG